ncbi:MAG: sensor histidine kinase [Pseudomonadales bacterium]
MRALQIIGSWLFFLPIFLHAAPLTLDQSSGQYKALEHAVYLEDPSGDLTIDEVMELPSQHFQPVAPEQFSGGYSDSAFWFKMTLFYRLPEAERERSHDWVLEIAYAALDYVDLYYQAHDSLSHSQSGDRRPQSVRNSPNLNHAFYLRFPPNQTQEVYLRVKTNSSLQIPITIWAPAVIFEQRSRAQLGFGIYIGVLLMMAAYNLLLFFSLREPSYLYYVLYISSFAFLQMSIAGVGSLYLWPASTAWSNIAIPFFMGASSLFAIFFTRHFLETYTHSAWTDRILKVVAALCALLMVLSFVSSYQVSLGVGNALTFVLSLALIWTGALATFKAYPGAKYFLMGWTCLLIGSTVFMLVSTGVLPPNTFTAHAAKYGSALEALLLALALGEKIKAVREEKSLIAERAREDLHAGNRELSLGLAQLERSDALKDEFLAKVSHELRTPLNGILGSLELLQLEDIGPRIEEYAQSANISAEHMLELVNTLLGFTEAQSQTSDEPTDLIHLSDISKQLQATYLPQLREKGLRLSIDLHDELPPLLIGDESKLCLILKQLLDNATKFSSDGTMKLTVLPEKLSINTSIIKFVIQDCGKGIEEEYLKSVFDPFSQASSSRDGGLGMGLAICRQLVLRMHGQIHAAPCTEGARIVMCLPFKLPKDSARAI